MQPLVQTVLLLHAGAIHKQRSVEQEDNQLIRKGITGHDDPYHVADQRKCDVGHSTAGYDLPYNSDEVKLVDEPDGNGHGADIQNDDEQHDYRQERIPRELSRFDVNPSNDEARNAKGNDP